MSGPGPALSALLQGLLLVCLAGGGALGAALRLRLTSRHGDRGLLMVNTTAALTLGLTLGLALPLLSRGSGALDGVPAVMVLSGASSLLTGFCLALGTWSTVAAQAADAVLAGRWGVAGRIWAAHLGLGLAAVVVGGGAGLGLRAVLGG